MKLNVDDNQQTAARFGVRSIPTIIIFKDGEKVDSLVGAMEKNQLMQSIKKILS